MTLSPVVKKGKENRDKKTILKKIFDKKKILPVRPYT